MSGDAPADGRDAFAPVRELRKVGGERLGRSRQRGRVPTFTPSVKIEPVGAIRFLRVALDFEAAAQSIADLNIRECRRRDRLAADDRQVLGVHCAVNGRLPVIR